MATMAELWTNTGSALATLMFIYTIFNQYFPTFGDNLQPFIQRLTTLFDPYIQVTFFEYTGQNFKRSVPYDAIQNYLSKDSSARAKRLKANTVKGSKSLVLSMDDYEEITDDFEGIKVWWQSNKEETRKESFSFYPGADEKRYYMLRFHRRDREIGKAWKRGYLLYGPPGTGKSTMIAAMANFLDYDVYDLELTTVRDNTQLRRLLIDTSAKSIIVIEDIDCSLDLTGQRRKKEEEKEDGDEKSILKKMMENEDENTADSKVTLSGLIRDMFEAFNPSVERSKEEGRGRCGREEERNRRERESRDSPQ
ncbi:unnamed protein product [Brassica rapa subsp. narinosa]